MAPSSVARRRTIFAAWPVWLATASAVTLLLVLGVRWFSPAHGEELAAQGSVSGNDNFASAWAIDTLPFIGEQDTTGMTTEAGEPLQPDGCIAPQGTEMGATVWYRFTASDSGFVAASTGGSFYDTVVAVYTGPSLDALTLVACNDDSIGVQSRAVFDATAGSTYHIQVGGYDGDTGDLRLLVQTTTSPPPTPTATSMPPADTGDVTCDGSITSLDALLLLQFVASLIQSLPCPDAADVNASGDISAIDATIVLQFVAGLIGNL